METTILHVTAVNVYNKSDKGADCEITFKEEIDGFRKARDAKGKVIADGAKEKGKVSSISFNVSALTKMMCDCNDDVEEFRGSLPRQFNQAQLNLILKGATMKVVRTFVEARTPIPDAFDADGVQLTYQYDHYETEVVGLDIAADRQKRIYQIIDNFLMGKD